MEMEDDGMIRAVDAFCVKRKPNFLWTRGYSLAVFSTSATGQANGRIPGECLAAGTVWVVFHTFRQKVWMFTKTSSQDKTR